MTAPVPQAAVDAAQKTRGCSPIRRTVGERRGPLVCNMHGCEWSDAGCLVAVDVAAAVVAAVQGPLKAEALREAADEFEEFAFVDDKRFKTVNTAAVRLNAARILRARADRIGGESDPA